MYGILGTVKVSCVKVYYSRSQGGGYVDIWVSRTSKNMHVDCGVNIGEVKNLRPMDNI